jgi:cytochrome c oxidase cbb3-type subunit IV
VTIMDSTYKALAEFAQTWGLVLFVIAFAAVVAYALWPSNKKKFDDVARTALREDD